MALPSRANTMKNWNRLMLTSCSRFILIIPACCMIRSVKSVSVCSMKGASSSIATKTTMIFGTKVRVTSWIWVNAWNSEMIEADQQRDQHQRRAELQRHDDRVAADLEENCLIHALSPCIDALRSAYARFLGRR